MKDRLLTLAGAALSVLVVLLLLTPPPAPGDKISLPTTQDQGRQGLAGLHRWLQDNRVPVASLRKRYNALPSSSGNLLVLSLPHRNGGQDGEYPALRDWLGAGNQVLILAAYGDSPPWSENGDWDSANQLLADLGISVESVENEDLPAEDGAEIDFSRPWREILGTRESRELALEAVAPHPLTEGVRQVRIRYYPGFDRLAWQILFSGPSPASALRLLREPVSDSTTLWQVPVGRGQIWLSSHADWLGNVSLGWADNARLLGNLLNLALGAEGRVIFDDYHFGLSELYDPEAFFADSRLHNTLWFFAAFWLLYVLGYSNRLAPPQPRPKQIHAVDFIRATAGLFARRLSRQSVAHGLIQHFFGEVHARHRQPPDPRPPWALLAKSSRVAHTDLARLQSIVRQLDQGKAPDLIELSRLLHRMRIADIDPR
jgi:hypothetical protein